MGWDGMGWEGSWMDGVVKKERQSLRGETPTTRTGDDITANVVVLDGTERSAG